MTEPDRRTHLRAALSGARVMVIGDVMVDDYLWGEVQRVSPEAPVPLVELTHRTSAPGGAANVARGVAALGGRAFLAGVVGDDADGVRLRAMVEASGVVGDGLLVAAGRPTTTKLRVIARGQHVVRIDHERRDDVSDSISRELQDWAHARLPDVDAVVVSDYAKGVVSLDTCARVIAATNEAGIPVIVDPKGPDVLKYAGASVITPNVREAELAARAAPRRDADPIGSLAEQLAELLPGTSVLITRGGEGMLLRSADRRITNIAVEARAVHDVTGAGDTVVATLAVALAKGVALVDAARLANRTAAIAVTRIGAVAVTLDDVADGQL